MTTCTKDKDCEFCPDHNRMREVLLNLAEKIEDRVKAIDEIWAYIKEHTDLLYEQGQIIARMRGKANGIAKERNASGATLNTMIQIVRLVFYIVFSAVGVIFAIQNIL